jgi:hypothetical protein
MSTDFFAFSSFPRADMATKNPRKRLRTATSPPPERPAVPTVYQRILYPSASATPPPRILHSPSHSTLDPLLLDLVALSLRAYVTPWYNGGISRDPDKAFLQAVTAVLVHVIQSLEVRLSALDWTELLIHDLPCLLAQHYRDWDSAVEKAGGGTAHNLSPELVFHRLQPHTAIHLAPSPSELAPSEAEPCVPQVDKLYLRALVDHLLKLLLPPADYRAETERTIVREILVGVVFGSVFNRVAQPWFIHVLIAKQLEAREVAKAVDEADKAKGKNPEIAAPTPLDKIFAALSGVPSTVWSVWSTFSTFSRLSTSTPLPSHYASQLPLHTSLPSLLLAILPSSTFLNQTIHYLSLPLALCSSFIDSLLVHFVTKQVATEATLKVVLEGAIRGMFPNDGWPAAKEDDPDEEQQEDLKRRCEEAVAKALPCTFSVLPSQT